MIRHIVMWTLRDAADAPRFKALLDSCKGLVPGMIEFEVGIRGEGLEANADVVLVSSFADVTALRLHFRWLRARPALQQIPRRTPSRSRSVSAQPSSPRGSTSGPSTGRATERQPAKRSSSSQPINWS